MMVPKAVTDKLGWWSVGAASEDYIRSYRVLIAKVQSNVASFIRAALKPDGSTTDIFGEAMVLEEMNTFIRSKNPSITEEVLQRLAQSLSIFTTTGPSEHPKMEDLVWKEDNLLDYTPQFMGKSSIEEDSDPEEATSSTAAMPGIGAWIVSLGMSHRTCCLHIVGSCYRKPTIHFKKWTVVHDPVPSSLYRKACQKCFPRGYPLVTPELQEVVEATIDESMPAEIAGSDESSSSSGSSSNSDN
jgi:hypothetical protein